MVNDFRAVLETCEKCGKEYNTHQSAECPHERFVDLMVKKPDKNCPICKGKGEYIWTYPRLGGAPSVNRITCDCVNKPSEGRLLTDEEVEKFWQDCSLPHKQEYKQTIYSLIKRVSAKTASIKDAERQLAIEIADQQGFEAGCEEKDAEHQQKLAEIFEYECKDCSTPGFRHLVIPEKVASRMLGGK